MTRQKEFRKERKDSKGYLFGSYVSGDAASLCFPYAVRKEKNASW